MISLLAVHFATIFSRKLDFAILAFVMTLLFSAMAFSNWMAAPLDTVKCGWFALMLFDYAAMYIFTASDRGKCAFFLARKRLHAWCWTQVLAHLLLSLVFIALFSGAYCLRFSQWIEFLPHAGCMMVFAFIFSQATLTTLQPAFSGFKESKKQALLLVTSAPWILTAWLFGLSSSDAISTGESATLPVSALILLGLIQTALSLAGLFDIKRK